MKKEGAKIRWFFAQLYKNPTDSFVLEGPTVSVVDFKIVCSPHQMKEKNICS